MTNDSKQRNGWRKASVCHVALLCITAAYIAGDLSDGTFGTLIAAVIGLFSNSNQATHALKRVGDN